MRAFVFALSVFLWLLLGWFLFQSNKECCQGRDSSGEVISQVDESAERQGDDSESAISNADDSEAATSDVRSEAALSFNWGEVNPNLGSNWETYKNSLVNGMGDDQNLEIKGLYNPDEENNTTYENLGLARANEVLKLLSPPIPSDRLQVTSGSIDQSVEEGESFSAIDFRTFIKKNNIDESIPDRTIIRFQQNSTNRIEDPEVEAYLAKVAERIMNSGERISLTGHTDRLGTYASNLELGKRRADAIKSYLISRGVQSSKILVDSKGETSPIASNSTDVGRAQNRRVELQIIK